MRGHAELTRRFLAERISPDGKLDVQNLTGEAGIPQVPSRPAVERLLGSIGQLLRHKHLESTAINAKVDPARLRQAAHPWPGTCTMTPGLGGLS